MKEGKLIFFKAEIVVPHVYRSPVGTTTPNRMLFHCRDTPKTSFIYLVLAVQGIYGTVHHVYHNHIKKRKRKENWSKKKKRWKINSYKRNPYNTDTCSLNFLLLSWTAISHCISIFLLEVWENCQNKAFFVVNSYYMYICICGVLWYKKCAIQGV